MATDQLTAATDRELQRVIGTRRLVPVEIGGRRALIQLLDDELDLDALIDRDPVAAAAIEQGVRDVDAGHTVDHEEVVTAINRS